jgi:hypothetical protein
MGKQHIDLLYIDEDLKECDRCDKQKSCASIMIYDRVCMIICKDCLMEIVKEFDDEIPENNA